MWWTWFNGWSAKTLLGYYQQHLLRYVARCILQILPLQLVSPRVSRKIEGYKRERTKGAVLRNSRQLEYKETWRLWLFGRLSSARVARATPRFPSAVSQQVTKARHRAPELHGREETFHGREERRLERNSRVANPPFVGVPTCRVREQVCPVLSPILGIFEAATIPLPPNKRVKRRNNVVLERAVDDFRASKRGIRRTSPTMQAESVRFPVLASSIELVISKGNNVHGVRVERRSVPHNWDIVPFSRRKINSAW